jgi:hypothetical protein
MARKIPPSRARPAKKAATEDQRSRLRRMLAEAMDQVDEEGLLFLLRQANVLIHNRKVEETNRELEELSAGSPRRDAPSAPGPRSTVTIEDDGKAAVFLTLGETRKVLDRDEVKHLVRVCYSTDRKSEALSRLYAVLKRERSDIINDAGIAGSGSPFVGGLFDALRGRYHLDDR